MDIDPMESATAAREELEGERAAASRLSSWVAITVALLATFLGVCKVKDDNLVQAMQQAQADKLDHWAFYQARNIRQEVAQAALDQLEAVSAGQPAAAQARTAPLAARYQALVADQKAKKDSVRVQAEGDQRTYDA